MLVVGAVAAAVAVHRLVTRRPALRVDRAGVAVGRAGVPWTGVAGIEVRLLLRMQTVVVLVGPEGRTALDAGQSRGGRLLRTVRGGSVWGLPTGRGLADRGLRALADLPLAGRRRPVSPGPLVTSR